MYRTVKLTIKNSHQASFIDFINNKTHISLIVTALVFFIFTPLHLLLLIIVGIFVLSLVRHNVNNTFLQIVRVLRLNLIDEPKHLLILVQLMNIDCQVVVLLLNFKFPEKFILHQCLLNHVLFLNTAIFYVLEGSHRLQPQLLLKPEYFHGLVSSQ